MKSIFTFMAAALKTLVLLTFFTSTGCSQDGWHNTRRDSAGLAPLPESTPEAVLQVYGANAWGWRGWFAIHTWVAVKPSDASSYTVLDVAGWRGRGGGSVVRIRQDIPDRYWFGAKPEIIAEHRGEGVDELIADVLDAADNYPWKTTYKGFPGPNSNTFTAWIGREVPRLNLQLPFSAIGKGYKEE
ncbi:MAG: DUF3750 domain-containing protein [Desulfocapsaceae bacterium]|nr:DUF3750 domain-containing protein [Desulfocapsaceae bacterium]